MICVFIRSLTKGGAENQSIILSKVLSKQYKTILVVLRGNLIDKEYEKLLKNARIKVFKLRGNIFFKLITFYKLLKTNEVKIIFNYLLSDNFWGAIIGKMAGVSYIIGGIRNYYIPRKKLYLMKFLHHYFQYLTIFNNESGRQKFIKECGFNKLKCITIQNCLITIPKLILRQNKTIISILSVGRFTYQKDYETLIKSIALLKNKLDLDFKFTVTIIGYGELEKQIRSIINKKKLNDIIHLVINPKDLPEYYKNTDIYISTSIYEGLSNSIMEAMSFSLPIVASNVGDNSCLVSEDYNGFLFEKSDYTSAANHLAFLINSYNTRIKMGQHSLEHLTEKFSVEKFSSNYYRLIDSLISKTLE